jgi:hypothetical protein
VDLQVQDSLEFVQVERLTQNQGGSMGCSVALEEVNWISSDVNDDRSWVEAGDELTSGHSTYALHANVEEDVAITTVVYALDSLLAVFDRLGRVAQVLERLNQELTNALIVVGDEHWTPYRSQGPDERPMPMARLDETLLGQPLQRLPQRHGGDAHRPGEGRLSRQGAAGWVLALLDSGSQMEICTVCPSHPLASLHGLLVN